MLIPTELPKKKLILVDGLPSSINTTFTFLERKRLQELEQLKEATMIWRVETWPWLTLNSSHGNLLSLEKLKFLSYREDNPSTFWIWKAAVIFWLQSTENIPMDSKTFLELGRQRIISPSKGHFF